MPLTEVGIGKENLYFRFKIFLKIIKTLIKMHSDHFELFIIHILYFYSLSFYHLSHIIDVKLQTNNIEPHYIVRENKSTNRFKT